jgi:hypothetical protein
MVVRQDAKTAKGKTPCAKTAHIPLFLASALGALGVLAFISMHFVTHFRFSRRLRVHPCFNFLDPIASPSRQHEKKIDVILVD